MTNRLVQVFARITGQGPKWINAELPINSNELITNTGGGGGGNAVTSGTLAQFAATTSAQLAGVISDEQGSGALVFANSPTLITPNLGTPSAINLTNATALPVTGGGTGAATATLGSIVAGTGSNTAATLPGNTAAYAKVLTQKGTGSVSAAPAWIAPASIPLVGLDPTGVADANNDAVTGLISAQLLAIAAAGGGVAFLPPGTFSITVAVSVPSNVTLRGAGIGRTVLKPTNGATASSGGGFVAFEGVSNAAVEDLTVDMSLRPATINLCGDGIVFCAASTASAAETIAYTGGAAGTHFRTGLIVKDVTSGATATIVKATPATATTGTLWVDNIVGTFGVHTITDSGAGSATGAAVSNPNTHFCAVRRCAVLGLSSAANTYLIWVSGATDIDIVDCYVDGQLVLETGAHEFYDGTTVQDNNGIEIASGRRIRIFNNTVVNMGRTAIALWSLDSAALGDTANVHVAGNLIRSCNHGISAQSTFSNANQLHAISNCLIENNRIKNVWSRALSSTHSPVNTLVQTLVWATETGTFVIGQRLTGTWSGATATIVVRNAGASTLTLTDVSGRFVPNEPITDTSTGVGTCAASTTTGTCGSNAIHNKVIWKNNIVDNTGSLKDANHSQYGCNFNFSVDGFSFPGCKFIGNALIGNGGSATGANLLTYAHGWQISENTFDETAYSVTVDAVSIQNSKGMQFKNNTISNSINGGLHAVACADFICSGNSVLNWCLKDSAYGVALSITGSAGVKITDNYMNRTGLPTEVTHPIAIYDATATNTYVELMGNRYSSNGLGQGNLGYGVDESGFADNATFTHLQGVFTPGNAISAFRVNHRDIQTTSRITVNQIGGTGGTATLVLTVAAGIFTITKYVATVATNFVASDKFSYSISN